MADEATPAPGPGTAQATAPTTPADSGTGTQQAAPATQGNPKGSSGDAPDAAYDQAFEQFFGPNANPVDGDGLGDPAPETPAQPATPTPQQPGQPPWQQPATQFPGQPGGTQQAATTGDTQPQTPGTPTTGLSDDDRQLLQRSHLDAEAIAAMPDTQRQAFVANLRQRESDQMASWNAMNQQVQALQQQVAQLNGGQDAPDGGGQQPTYTDQVQETIDSLADTFGDEVKPLATLFQGLHEQNTQLQQQAGQVQPMSRLVVDLTMDNALRDLASAFPSLSEPDSRQKVLDAFKNGGWANSPHRQAQGATLDRIKAALRETATGLLGTPNGNTAAGGSPNNQQATQHAQQQAQQLAGQPQAGHARGRDRPVTEDDVYSQAFDAHLAPDVRAGR